MKKLFFFFLLFFFLFFKKNTYAIAPVGYLDGADGQKIWGWTKDNDYSGPIRIHIYIDGVLVHHELADTYRADVGSHGYRWDHSPLGAGDHQVIVYAIGVDQNGQPNNENPGLRGSPKTISANCSLLTGSPNEWCRHNPNYWVNRQKDTKLLFNQHITVGINNSYGGIISQLYNHDHSKNIINEHGGAAIQLSLWGYDSTAPSWGWFAKQMSVCDPTPYQTEEECLSKYSECWSKPNGANVCDCQNIISCVNWGAAAPWNPIQAQAQGCLWDHSSNDVNYSYQPSSNSWEIRLDNPYNFTQTDSFQNMSFDQKVTLGDAYARIDYTIQYSGPYTTDSHSQEIPAIFTSTDINYYFYYYQEGLPYSDPKNSVTKIGPVEPIGRALAFPNYTGTKPHFANPTEKWWGVCDQTEQHCLTIATSSPEIDRASISTKDAPESGSYLTALGSFHFYPNMHKEITVYLFPYKHDDLVNGKTIRERIFDLTAPPPTSTPPQPTDTIIPTSTPFCASCSESNPSKSEGNSNCDAHLNLTDFSIWLEIYQKILKGSPLTSQELSSVDFNCQENQTTYSVNLTDFSIWLENYQKILN